MRKITLLIFLLISVILNAQVKEIITHFPIDGLYYDRYGTFDNIKFFHDQYLLNFSISEEFALVSYYSNTSKKTFEKYVLTSGEREVIYHFGSETKGKLDSLISNGFDQNLSNHYQELDTSQSWIDIYFKLKFKYNDEDISIVSYRTVENGRPNGRYVERFLSRYEVIEGKANNIFYIDHRDDKFLNDITLAIGILNKTTIRILLGIDKPKTMAEKEIFNLATSFGESLKLNTLIELYKNQDERLMQFYK